MSTHTCPIPVCQDSQLATAASVIGIMTFVSAALAGILAAWLQAMKIRSELRELLSSFHSAVGQLTSCIRELEQDHGYREISGANAELFDQLRILAKRGAETVDEIRSMVDRISDYDQYGRFRSLRSIVAGTALKDSMDEKVKKAQRILNELQLGMIQL
jgi:hypothetical protein